MGLQEAEPIAQLVEIAQRLRQVRAARRRFLLNWAMGEKPESRRKNPRLRRGTNSSSQRQLNLFDDL